jgi:hypothetical protein
MSGAKKGDENLSVGLNRLRQIIDMMQMGSFTLTALKGYCLQTGPGRAKALELEDCKLRAPCAPRRAARLEIGSSMRPVILTLMLMLSMVAPSTGSSGEDMLAQVQLLEKAPDVTFSGTFDLPTRSDILNNTLDSPMLLARLWEVYQFSPIYKARLQGNGIHVDDPTGISGDVFLVEHSANRRVYLGVGALNHSLVPAFRGKMALVLSTVPKGSGLSARIDIFVRTDSRLLGLVTWAAAPVLRPRIENRVTVNAGNIGTILQDLSTQPQKAAALLSKEDAAALLKILPTASAKR